MNIICNNCVGARLYNVSGREFNNPFTWCTIYPDEFIKLIKDFNNIDFYNIKVYLEKFQQREYPSICLELENGVKIHYIHYIYKDCEFEKNHPEVYSKKIFEYFMNLYYRRLDRMIKLNEKPLFLFSFNYLGKNYNNYYNVIDELISINNANICIIAHKEKVKENVYKNIILLDDDTMNLTGTFFCKKIKHHFFDDTLEEKIQEKAYQKKYVNFNIDNPQTWCEKMQWLQLHDDIQLRAKCADKIKVHEYSVEKLGKDICVPIIKIYNSPDDIKFDELPNKFVLKCNHGYAFNIICRDKNELNENECRQKIKQWLEIPFGEKSIEPHYLEIERKCYAEKFIENPGQLEVTDYKFICFNGIPEYVQIFNNRHQKEFHANYYDMNFNFVDISKMDIKNDPTKLDTKPSQFELMKEYAKKLSEDFRFVRVDFYEVNDIVYLGELTFTPATGFIRWTDPTIDKIFGEKIKL